METFYKGLVFYNILIRRVYRSRNVHSSRSASLLTFSMFFITVYSFLSVLELRSLISLGPFSLFSEPQLMPKAFWGAIFGVLIDFVLRIITNFLKRSIDFKRRFQIIRNSGGFSISRNVAVTYLTIHLSLIALMLWFVIKALVR